MTDIIAPTHVVIDDKYHKIYSTEFNFWGNITRIITYPDLDTNTYHDISGKELKNVQLCVLPQVVYLR